MNKSNDKDKKESQNKELATNRRAFFEYEVIDTLEVGIALVGTEIKSLREHGASIQEAYVTVDNGELWLIASSITPYRFGSVYNHEEKRKRKLLAHKREIIRLGQSIQEKGLTCIPLAMYLKKGIAKVKIAICKGKKLHDKRTAIHERDDKREMQRMMKHV
jgi:SsrA-binding protein